MAMQGRLQKDPLFMALTRPTMIFGVTYSYVAIEGGYFLLYFINMDEGRFMAFLHVLVLHAIGIMICSHEPRFAECIQVAAKVNTKCVNKRFHDNTASYDVY